MFIPEWFIIAVAVFILISLIRLAQLHNQVEELRDCVAKLEEGSGAEDSDLENKMEADSGGD